MNQRGKFDVHGSTVRGRENDRNHDHFAIATLNKSMRVHQTNLSIDDESRVHGHNQGHLFLVADGVGGGDDPARASGTAVDSVVHYFLNEMPWYHFGEGKPADVVLALEDALQNSQEEIMREAALDGGGMGTTMTLAFVFWPEVYIAHVGDSRCYLERGGNLRQLTTEHALAKFDEDGDEGSKRGSSLRWNLVGADGRELHPEVRHVTLHAGDVLALVTDGVSHETPEGELRSILARTAPAEEVCERLVGGPGADDRTAIVVRFLPLEERHAGVDPDTSRPPLTEREAPPTPVVDRKRVASEELRRLQPPRHSIAAAW